jgi:hypothetical protein
MLPEMDGGEDPTIRLTDSAALPANTAHFFESAFFSEPVVRFYHQDISYTTQQYLDVLNTYSGHRDLSESDHRGLFGCIGETIDSRFNGGIVKRYRNDLLIAKRL